MLIGISKEDTIEDLKYMKDKILNLRIFEDEMVNELILIRCKR